MYSLKSQGGLVRRQDARVARICCLLFGFGVLTLPPQSAKSMTPTAAMGLLQVGALLPGQCCQSTTCVLWWCWCNCSGGSCTCPCGTKNCGSSCLPSPNVVAACCGFFAGVDHEECLTDNAL